MWKWKIDLILFVCLFVSLVWWWWWCGLASRTFHIVCYKTTTKKGLRAPKRLQFYPPSLNLMKMQIRCTSPHSPGNFVLHELHLYTIIWLALIFYDTLTVLEVIISSLCIQIISSGGLDRKETGFRKVFFSHEEKHRS